MLVLAPRALAHEGHGDPNWYDSILHHLEPVHLPLTLAVLVVLVLLAPRWVSKKAMQTDGASRRC